MDQYEFAIYFCIFAIILTLLLLCLAFRKQKKTQEVQRMIDARGDRGLTLFLGNPRPSARQTGREWEAYQREMDEFERSGKHKRWHRDIIRNGWYKEEVYTPKQDLPPAENFGLQPWEMDDKDK